MATVFVTHVVLPALQTPQGVSVNGGRLLFNHGAGGLVQPQFVRDGQVMVGPWVSGADLNAVTQAVQQVVPGDNSLPPWSWLGAGLLVAGVLWAAASFMYKTRRSQGDN